MNKLLMSAFDSLFIIIELIMMAVIISSFNKRRAKWWIITVSLFMLAIIIVMCFTIFGVDKTHAAIANIKLYDCETFPATIFDVNAITLCATPRRTLLVHVINEEYNTYAILVNKDCYIVNQKSFIADLNKALRASNDEVISSDVVRLSNGYHKYDIVIDNNSTVTMYLYRFYD